MQRQYGPRVLEGNVKIAAKFDGFSLIEMIVVMAILGVILAIAVPNWRSLLASYALNNSARQIQSELHNLKMRAAAENTGFQLSYLQDANEYTIQRDSKPLQSKPIAVGTSITKAGTISFSPRGTAGPNRVRLRNANGSCRQIVVSATGRVRNCTPNNCVEDC
jgi:prepilin-type N-terminal cleavage/methylation domain-containing protein